MVLQRTDSTSPKSEVGAALPAGIRYSPTPGRIVLPRTIAQSIHAHDASIDKAPIFSKVERDQNQATMREKIECLVVDGRLDEKSLDRWNEFESSLPKVGDEVVLGNVRLSVETVEGRTIGNVRVWLSGRGIPSIAGGVA